MITLKKFGQVLLCASALALAACDTDEGPASETSTNQLTAIDCTIGVNCSDKLLTMAEYDWASTTTTYEDTSRGVAAYGSVAAQVTRVLPSKIWYPVNRATGQIAEGPFPLIVHSHGFTSNYDEVAYMAEFLAQQGYIVASFNQPATSVDWSPASLVGGLPETDFNDVPNLPGDVRFVIDSLLADNTNSAALLFKKINADKIGLSGVSLGGMMTTMVGFVETHADERVKLAVAMAPAIFPSMPGLIGNDVPFTENVGVPFLQIHGDVDAFISYESQGLLIYNNANHPATLVTLVDGTHSGFSGALSDLANLIPPAILSAYVPGFQVGDNVDLIGCAFTGSLIEGGSGLDICNNIPQQAMSVERQQELTTLVTFAFFEKHFNEDADIQWWMNHFISVGLWMENSDVELTF